jgi:hypothetical protein
MASLAEVYAMVGALGIGNPPGAGQNMDLGSVIQSEVSDFAIGEFYWSPDLLASPADRTYGWRAYTSLGSSDSIYANETNLHYIVCAR